MIFCQTPCSSAGKESACNAGDPGLFPGSGGSAEEGIGYSLQYSWTSLVAQQVKNLHAMWETWVWAQGWEDPLEKGKTTHSSILAWKIPWTVQSLGSQRVGHDWVTFTKRRVRSLISVSKMRADSRGLGEEWSRNSELFWGGALLSQMFWVSL